jgi:hypothetical protein
MAGKLSAIFYYYISNLNTCQMAGLQQGAATPTSRDVPFR